MNEHLNTNANVYLLTPQMCICQVRKPRLRLDEYATRVEVGTFPAHHIHHHHQHDDNDDDDDDDDDDGNQVHDDLGQLDCAKSPTTLSREGAAAGFFQPADLSGMRLVCVSKSGERTNV